MVRVRNQKKLFAICWAAYTASYITRLGLTGALPEMIAAGVFGKTFGGAAGTAFFAAYGLGQLVNGFLGDRLQPGRMITAGLAGSAVMNLAMALVSGKWAFAAVWCLNGWFCSMLWGPVIRCISSMGAEGSRRAGVWISTTIPAGGILAALLAGAALRLGSYRLVFALSGVVGAAVCAVCAAVFSRMEPFSRPDRGGARAEGAGSSFLPLLLGSGLMFAAVCVLFNGVLKDGVTLWVPTMLADRFGVSPSRAAVISAVLPVINISGAFAARFIDRRLKNELATTAVMFGVSLLSLAAWPLCGGSALLSALLTAVCTSSMLGANTMLLTFVPLAYGRVGRAASVTGFLDACSYLASAAAAVSVGAAAESMGWSAVSVGWIAAAAAGMAVAAAGAPVWRRKKKNTAGE